MKLTDEELKKKAARYGYVGLFAHRDTIQEAYNYAVSSTLNMCDVDKVAATVAIQVLQNTHAILKAQQESDSDKFRRILQAAYCMDYDRYCEIMGQEQDYYSKEKWQLMQKNFSRWYCELDLGNAEKFCKGVLGDG